MHVILNGVNSRTIQGLEITSLPPVSAPPKRTNQILIDGRDGDILEDLGYSAYDKAFTILLHNNYDPNEVIGFFSQSGTAIFSNEPDMVYTYEMVNGIDIAKGNFNSVKVATITFHVQPYKLSATEEPETGEVSTLVDRTPYIIRRAPFGTRQKGTIVGGSVVWNQLCNNASVTVVNGHKYLLKKDGAYSIGASTGTALTGLTVGSDMVFDLTLMFGPTIADYIYTQEQATAGAGVALAKAWAGITADYYPYDAGTIKSVEGLTSHKMTGKNLAQVTIGDITWNNTQVKVNDDRSISVTGSPQSNGARAIGVAHLCEGVYVIDKADSTDYYLQVQAPNGQLWGNNASAIRLTVDTPADYTIRIFVRGGKIYNNVTIYPMIRYADAQDATFEPYTAHEYPLDSSLTLRGLLKLDGDSIYYDGDIYPPSGEVKRRYGAVDLGTLAWTKETISAGSSTYMFYSKLPTAKMTANNNEVANIVCPLYTATYRNALSGNDKVIAITNNGYLTIRDDDYTDAASFKTAMDGVDLVYESATPTTEQAEPYTALQICDPAGTEEWVGASMPVGHETTYIDPISMTVNNTGNTTSAPSITIEGEGTVEVTVDGLNILQIQMPASGEITIDSKALDATDGEGGLANRSVTGDYNDLRLTPGEHTVTVTGDVTSVTLKNTSRWI